MMGLSCDLWKTACDKYADILYMRGLAINTDV